MSKILIVAPHPDDETLGCGGTLFRHKAEGDDIYWVIITNISMDNGWSNKSVKIREVEIGNTAEKYGFTDVFNFCLPTTKIDTLPVFDLIEKITQVYKRIEPEIIYIPYTYDVHTDHQIVTKALQSTFKWFRYPYIKKVLMYETLSETNFSFINNIEFHPNVYVDISKYLNNKIETMKIFESELGEHPFPRSEKALRALATLRGTQSGYESAEAFQLVFERK